MGQHEWGQLSQEREREVNDFLQREPVHGRMLLAQAKSLRRTLLKERGIAVHAKVYSDGARLAALFRAGTSMQTLAQRFDYPPTAIFRSIISARSRSSKTEIKNMLQNPEKHFSDAQDIAAL